MKKNKILQISGRVQNVGFRYSASEKARRYHITGYVKNNTDGTVTLEAEGEEENLNEFIEWAKQGPPSADVEKAHIQEGPIQDYKQFSVK